MNISKVPTIEDFSIIQTKDTLRVSLTIRAKKNIEVVLLEKTRVTNFRDTVIGLITALEQNNEVLIFLQKIHRIDGVTRIRFLNALRGIRDAR